VRTDGKIATHCVLLLVVAFVSGCKPGIDRPLDDEVSRLNSFPLREGVTRAQFEKEAGVPDRIWGSGVPWLVYRLSSNEELRVFFELGGQRRLQMALIVTADGGQERERIVFEGNFDD